MHTLSRAAPLLAFGCLLLLAGMQLGALPNPMPIVTFHKLTPNMMVEDVNATVDFYRDVLGFDLVMTVPDSGRFDWALVRRDDIEMMFQTRASLAEDLPAFEDKPLGGALTFYLDVVGVDALYRQVQARVAVVKELHETFYGTREFAIKDVNGFILTFAEGGE